MNQRPAAKSFEDLVVWKKSHRLVMEIYRLSMAFPKHELYGLTSQLRRAAVSVPANIAEGFKKKSRMDKVRYYNIAQGSLEEVRHYLILTRDLAYGDVTSTMTVVEEVSRLLEAYCSTVKQSNLMTTNV